MDGPTPPEPEGRPIYEDPGTGLKPRDVATIVGLVLVVIYVSEVLATGGDANGDGIITPEERGFEWTSGIGFLIARMVPIVLAGVRTATDRNDRKADQMDAM